MCLGGANALLALAALSFGGLGLLPFPASVLLAIEMNISLILEDHAARTGDAFVVGGADGVAGGGVGLHAPDVAEVDAIDALPVGCALGVSQRIKNGLAEGCVGVEVLIVGGGGGRGGMVAGARGADGLGHLGGVGSVAATALATGSFLGAPLLVVGRMVESVVGKQRHALWLGTGSGGGVGEGSGGGEGGRGSGERCIAGVGLACVEGVVGGISRLATIMPGSAILGHFCFVSQKCAVFQ